MPSFDVINYSLRPSKSIQRQLVFEGARKIGAILGYDKPFYVGFGSIWFTDFVMAHKLLDIDDMVSIEGNAVGYMRAKFNSPYATVRVFEGLSHEILPELLNDAAWSRRPWMIWLDYDREFTEEMGDDIRLLAEKAPEDSILLVTFAGNEMKYGQASDRPKRLQQLFGSLVPDDLPVRACRDERMHSTLATFGLQFMQTAAADYSRSGGFIPAFQLIYKDGAPMVTIGGILPRKERREAIEALVNHANWPCRPDKPIVAPHLTIKEATMLQSQLPRDQKLSRELVQQLGFDLEDEHIEVFERYYRQYPAFAQIVA